MGELLDGALGENTKTCLKVWYVGVEKADILFNVCDSFIKEFLGKLGGANGGAEQPETGGEFNGGGRAILD